MYCAVIILFICVFRLVKIRTLCKPSGVCLVIMYVRIAGHQVSIVIKSDVLTHTFLHTNFTDDMCISTFNDVEKSQLLETAREF